MRRWIVCLLTCLCLFAGAAPANPETPSPSCALVADANALAAVSDPDHAYAVAIYGLEGPCSRDAVPDGLEWLRAGVRLGSVEAMRHLAMAMTWRSYGLTNDPGMELRLLKPAAETGDPIAMFEYGLRLLDRPVSEAWRMSKPARAIPWLEKAAAAGAPRAYWVLARVFNAGDWEDGPYAIDRDKAATYFRLASEQGDRLAEYVVHETILLGVGRPADPIEAARVRDQALAGLATGDGLPLDFRLDRSGGHVLTSCTDWDVRAPAFDGSTFGANPFATMPPVLLDELLTFFAIDDLTCRRYGHIVKMPLDEQIETRKWSYIRAGLSGSDAEAEMWRTLLTPEQDAEAARQADQWLFERQVEWTARQAE